MRIREKQNISKSNSDAGITLIALAITIMVLIALAGISITMGFSRDGVLTKTNESALMARAESIDEDVTLWKNDVVITKDMGGISKTEDEMLQSLKNRELITENDEIDTTNKVIKIKRKDGSIVKEISYNVNYTKIITFFIDSESYQAEAGMTWKQWCETEYNLNDKFGVGGGNVGVYGGAVYTKEGYVVYSTDYIINNYRYHSKQYAECVTPNSEILVDLNGGHKLAKNIQENDQIIYYDFDEDKIKLGKVENVYIHKDATNFVRYEFLDGTFLEVTDYHPIYTQSGWKSQTQRNGYFMPQIGDQVKTSNGWKELVNIKIYTDLEDCYDFKVIDENGNEVRNYFANETLVQASY